MLNSNNNNNNDHHHHIWNMVGTVVLTLTNSLRTILLIGRERGRWAQSRLTGTAFTRSDNRVAVRGT